MTNYATPYTEFGSNPFSDNESIRSEATQAAASDPNIGGKKNISAYFKLYSDTYKCINEWRKSSRNAELHAHMNDIDPTFINNQVNKIIRLHQQVELINSQPVNDYQAKTKQLYEVLITFNHDNQNDLPIITGQIGKIIQENRITTH